MSEASTSASIFAPYLQGQFVIELGAGGYRSVPHAWAFDQPTPYTSVGSDSQQLRGDCRNLGFLCDESIDAITQSHLLEDFEWSEMEKIMLEHRRVLKMGGYYAHNMPIEAIYREHCRVTGQSYNMAHANENLSLQTFKDRILTKTGPWKIVFEKKRHGPYSFLIVIQKI